MMMMMMMRDEDKDDVSRWTDGGLLSNKSLISPLSSQVLASGALRRKMTSLHECVFQPLDSHLILGEHQQWD